MKMYRGGGSVVIAQGGVLASHPWGSGLYPQHCPIRNSSNNNNKEAVCGGRWHIRLFVDSVYRGEASLIWLLSGEQMPVTDGGYNHSANLPLRSYVDMKSLLVELTWGRHGA